MTDYEALLHLSTRLNAVVHDLKVSPQYYDMIEAGIKDFELRKNDRNFQVGDWLFLREYDAVAQVYLGRAKLVQVTCIVSGEWLAPGYVAMGIRRLQ